MRMSLLWLLAGAACVLASAANAIDRVEIPASTESANDRARPDIITYGIAWHAINPGITRARNSCFLLSATMGQAVPGYASGAEFVVTSGFWAAAPITQLDEIYFNGFERCSP